MKYYYKLFTKEGLEESLKSIKAPESFIKEMLNIQKINKTLKNEPFVYIGCDYSNEDEKWKWSSYDNELGKDIFEKDNYIFKGEVKVEDYEIEAFKHITG